MHNSNDVGETVATMFAEFVHLGIHTNRCGILIFNDQYVVRSGQQEQRQVAMLN